MVYFFKLILFYKIFFVGKFLASGDVDGALFVWKISIKEDCLLSPDKEKVFCFFLQLKECMKIHFFLK